MVKNGKAIRTVISRAENEVTGLQAQQADARAQSLNAAAYFNFLLSKPLNSAIEVKPEDPAVWTDDNTVNSKREEIMALESAVKVNQLALGMNKSYALPKLSTFLDLGSQGDFIKVNKETPYYLFGLSLSWQIFSGNRNRNKVEQAKFDLKTAQTELSQAEQRLQVETEAAKNLLQAAVQSYKAAKSQTTLSQQYYKDEQRLYKEGQALYLELLDAQTRLINDQLKESIAFLNVQTRQTELERARASYKL